VEFHAFPFTCLPWWHLQGRYLSTVALKMVPLLWLQPIWMRFWANRCCPLFISKHCLIVLVELYIKMLSYTFFYVNHMFLLAPSSPYHTSFQILLFRSQFYAIPSCWWWLVQGRYLNKVALEWLVLAWLHPKLRLNMWANLNIPAMQCCESFSLPFVLCSLG